MCIRQLLLGISFFIFSSFINTALASKNASVEFFASNNTSTITVQTAYDRIIGQPQQELQNNMITTFQKDRIEQGQFTDAIGAYRMQTSQKMTADNTDIFSASTYQKISDEKVFTIAKQLAILLNQESVAVFIPMSPSPLAQVPISDVTLKFVSSRPTIPMILNLLSKLPTLYNEAFSLHLAKNRCGGYNYTEVTEVEWLGKNIKPETIKNAFKTEKVATHFGKAYLVYQNGQITQL